MYLYFSSNGTLKEIINDSAIRQGNSKINKLKIFIEGAEPQTNNQGIYQLPFFSSGVRTFIDVEGNELTTESFSLVPVVETIPFNKKRELKYFKYWEKYQFLEITVPDDILNESGTVGCRVQLILDEGEDVQATLDSDDTILTLGLIVFNVEITTGGKAVIEPDTAINIAQWNYLLKKMSEVDYYTDNVMFVAQNILLLQASNFNEGQVFYDKESKNFYKVIEVDSQKEFELEQLDIWNLENNGVKLIDILASKVDKTDLPNRLYGTDSSGNGKIYTIDEIREELNDVPSQQMTTTIIRNALTNINGRVLTAYEQETATIGGYNAIIIKKGGNQLTEDQARDYMEYMTGSRFLPQYDYEKPQNSIFIMANGTFWKPQYADNALVLYEISNPFELINNKVTTLSASNTDTQYPSAKAVYDNLVNVREVAEGKCKTIVISCLTEAPTTDAQARLLKRLDGTSFVDLADFNDYVDPDGKGVVQCINETFDDNGESISLPADEYDCYLIDVDGIVRRGTDNYGLSNNGDIILVIERYSEDGDIPDRWWYKDGDTAYILETAKMDLTNYYAKNANLIPTSTNTYDLGSAAATYKDLYLSGSINGNGSANLDIKNSTTTLRVQPNGFIAANYFIPMTNNGGDLGIDSNRWRYGWINVLKGIITLTQAQYDALVSGGTVNADTFYFIEEE